MTLRIGTQLVGLRADSEATDSQLRALLAAWVDDAIRDLPWVFDVRLDPHDRSTDDATGRGPRPVPQLRVGQVLLARSRTPKEVWWALASVLGGILARQDDSRLWSGMRPFSSGDRIVLVDAQPPALSTSPHLARAGISEIPTWNVAIDGPLVHVPPALRGLDWAAAGIDPLDPARMSWRTRMLAGIVALDPQTPDGDHSYAVDVDGTPQPIGRNEDASMLSRFGVRNPSPAWFSTMERLIRDHRAAVSSDRSVVERSIIEMIGR